MHHAMAFKVVVAICFPLGLPFLLVLWWPSNYFLLSPSNITMKGWRCSGGCSQRGQTLRRRWLSIAHRFTRVSPAVTHYPPHRALLIINWLLLRARALSLSPLLTYTTLRPTNPPVNSIGQNNYVGLCNVSVALLKRARKIVPILTVRKQLPPINTVYSTHPINTPLDCQYICPLNKRY